MISGNGGFAMKAILLVLAAAAAAAAFSRPAAAQAQPAARDAAAYEDARRQQSMLLQQERDARIQRARGKCLANRGGDCDTMEGLQEWLLLDRSRAEAVLDRVAPLTAGSASTGSSSVPGSTVPDLSPYNASAVPR
jgi:hypothetical protein